jgi:predicted Zn finger-like uncharacterized protein
MRIHMHIICPVCKFKGTISDNLIPDDGKHVRCPKCRAKIFLKKPVVSLTAGTRVPKESPGMELVGYDATIIQEVTGPEVTVIHARCENCGGDIKVPDNKKVLLCPTCGTNIVRQVIDNELEPGFIESFIESITQSFSSVFGSWGGVLRKRKVRRLMAAAAVCLAIYLLVYGLQKGSDSGDSPLNKNVDITFNFPTSAADTSGTEDEGVLNNLVRIEISPSDKKETEEVRIYRIVFKDGSTSDYFRYYRYDNGIVYVTLPDGKGGSYELGYEDSTIRSIKRVQDVPEGVKIYGVN